MRFLSKEDADFYIEQLNLLLSKTRQVVDYSILSYSFVVHLADRTKFKAYIDDVNKWLSGVRSLDWREATDILRPFGPVENFPYVAGDPHW